MHALYQADVRTLGLNSLYFIFTACAWVSHDYTGTLGMVRRCVLGPSWSFLPARGCAPLSFCGCAPLGFFWPLASAAVPPLASAAV